MISVSRRTRAPWSAADGCRSLTTNPIPLPPRRHAALGSRRLIVSDTESPFRYLKAFAVMRISPDITPKPTCKADFPRGKKNAAQPPLPPHTSPPLGSLCLLQLPFSRLTSHLLIFPPSWAVNCRDGGSAPPKSWSCHSTLDPTFTVAASPVYTAPSTAGCCSGTGSQHLQQV